MYRGLWAYPKVGKKPVCGAKISQIIDTLKGAEVKASAPFRIAKVL